MSKVRLIILADVVLAFGVGVLVGQDRRAAVGSIRVNPTENTGPAEGVTGSPSLPHRLPSPPHPAKNHTAPVAGQGSQSGSATGADLFSVIRQVESGGNDYAVGDDGRSRGPVQCGRAAWKDACEYGKADLDYDEYVWNYAACKQVMTWYWARYGCDTDEKKARCWNGGPAGYLKESTIPYWKKVKEICDERNLCKYRNSKIEEMEK